MSDPFAQLDLDDIVGGTDYPVRDLENFNPDVALASPLVLGATVAAYATKREGGLSELEKEIRDRAREAKYGSFNKTDALYLPLAPPPAAWDYRCQNCRFFNEGPKRRGGTCDIVGNSGDPFGGERINPDAWCALWMPIQGKPFLTYLKNRLEGRDE